MRNDAITTLKKILKRPGNKLVIENHKHRWSHNNVIMYHLEIFNIVLIEESWHLFT